MINLGSIKMPLNAATKTFALLAKRGAGKSYTGAVMAEEFFKNDIPFVVFDPIDVWWSLRLAADGKSKGLPVVVFGIEHADIQLTRDMGRQIAQAVVKANVSCVISTFGMSKTAERHLIAEFAEEILNINNTPRHIFIEEAHEYVPQRVMGALGRTFNAVSNLVVMGRNRGIGVTLINQRAATINKDVLTQLDTLLAFRNTSPQDRKALKEWVEHHEAEGDFTKFINSLPSLETGKGWIWSPEFMGVFEQIQIRKRETFDPNREKASGTFVMPKLEQMDVADFIANFSVVVEDKKQPHRSKVDKALGDDVKSISVGEAIQMSEEIAKAVSAKERELRNEYESQLVQKDGRIRQLENKIQQIANIIGHGHGGVDISGEVSIPPVFMESKNESIIENLPKYEKDIIMAIKQHAGIPFTRSQLAVKSGKSFTSSAFPRAINTLIKLNLIRESGKDLIY